ncbi:MAG: HD domain-containing phosphohydrolase [Desulfobacterales bacterium]
MTRVLVVDDEKIACETITKFLYKMGFSTEQANDGLEALEKCGKYLPEVVILDIKMPKLNGLEALKKIKVNHPDMQVIMVTAVEELDTAINCMQLGAYGYLSKPINLKNLQIQINKALEHRKLLADNKEYHQELESKVKQRTREIYSLHQELEDSFMSSVRVLVGLLEMSNPDLGAHLKRVAIWSKGIANEIDLPDDSIVNLEIAALLHDIGMFVIPDRLIRSSYDDLNKDEIELVKKHTVFAQSILSPSSGFTKAGLIIRHHLENIDGTGFPDGLSGDEIPQNSRILAVANAYDEIRYRKSVKSIQVFNEDAKDEYVRSHLYKWAGKRYQIELIAALIRAVEKIQRETISNEQINVEDLRTGMKLSHNIHTIDGKLLMAKDMVINQMQINKLKTAYKLKLSDQDIYIVKKNKKITN